MDRKLSEFAGKKVDALIIDLRASSLTEDFEAAAEFAKRFIVKGKPLFTMRKAGARQERAFTSDRDPVYQGTMMILADADTAGPAEVLAGVHPALQKSFDHWTVHRRTRGRVFRSAATER